MDETPDVGEGIDAVFPHLGEPGGAVDCTLDVGRVEIGILRAAGHIGDK